jgi:hypothetical protein
MGKHRRSGRSLNTSPALPGTGTPSQAQLSRALPGAGTPSQAQLSRALPGAGTPSQAQLSGANTTRSASYRPVSSRPVSSRPSQTRPSQTRPASSRPVSSQQASSRPNSSRPVSSRPVTLVDLQQEALAIFCWCHQCGHNAELDSQQLVGRFGGLLPVPELARHIRCSKCGGKQISTRPAWPSWGGQIARHD